MKSDSYLFSTIKFAPLLFAFLIGCSSPELKASEKGQDYMQLSIDFLEALKKGQPTNGYVEQYADIDLDSLAAAIDTREEKLAFWINTYNAFIQDILSKDASLFDDRGAFFSKERVNIAGEMLSFDDIEHGIIRSSRWKLSLGYLKNPFAAKHIRMLRTDEPDGRIHFALNCGAASCPPVASYHATRIDQELDFIAKQYLKMTTEVKEDKVTVTPLMSWFRGDFGGKKGIVKDYLIPYGIIDAELDPDLEFGDYDWTLSLGNYTDIEIE
jgi:hypothetical protein